MRHDRVVTEARIAAVEGDFAFPQPPFGVRHRVHPLAGTHGVAGAKPVDWAEPGARNDGEQRMKTPPPRFAGIVADLCTFLMSILGLHRRIPIQHDRVGQRTPHRFGVPGDPLGAQHRIDRLEKTPHRIVADDRLHPEQLRDRRILAHALDMREPAPVSQRRQHERLDHIVDRCRVRAGALNRTVGRQVVDDADMFGVRRPRHQSAKRRQRIVRHRKSHPATRRRKAEISFT